MKKKLSRISKIILVSYSVILLLTSFQNCGQVNIENMPSLATPVTPTNFESISYLKIDNTSTDVFRAAFIVDMSQSMYAGPCLDSIDTALPNVPASENCMAPTGVDPRGKRFQILLNWIEDLQQQIARGSLNENQVKIIVLPFSGPVSRIWKNDINAILRGTNLNFNVSETFVSLDLAKKYLFLLWALESKLHGQTINARVPADIKNAVLDSAVGGVASGMNASSGTSMVAHQIENLNQQLNLELQALKNQNMLGKSHFEIVFMSDGVPKPHSKHIEEAVKYIWMRKNIACEGTSYFNGYYANCETGYINPPDGRWIDGVVENVDASSCVSRCSDYLRQYADTGSVNLPASESPTCTSYFSLPPVCNTYSDGSNINTRWSSQIKCGQCFRLLRQFDWNREGNRYYDFRTDNFITKTERIWGKWFENRHSYIITKLRTTVNIFKIQHPGAAAWKMSFLRIDSDVNKYKTPPGELDREINWIVRAQEIFGKKHRFFVVAGEQKPFDLFSELQNGQSYRLGMLYVYNRNLRANSVGNFQYDLDGDGIADHLEALGQVNSARSNTVCLDNIQRLYSACISVGCQTSVDRDGDGLNQCEESVMGTDDFEADSDGDGILDGSEILFDLNPMVNDQTVFTSADGLSNFQHFVKGYSSMVDLRNIPENRHINITTDLVGFRTIKDHRNIDILVPGYSVKVRNLPIENGKENEIVVVGRIDNLANPTDSRWISKTYRMQSNTESLNIDLSEFENLDLEAP